LQQAAGLLERAQADGGDRFYLPGPQPMN
jgi:hypothetical protein